MVTHFCITHVKQIMVCVQDCQACKSDPSCQAILAPVLRAIVPTCQACKLNPSIHAVWVVTNNDKACWYTPVKQALRVFVYLH